MKTATKYPRSSAIMLSASLLRAAFHLSLLAPLFILGTLDGRLRRLGLALRLATMRRTFPLERRALLLEWLIVGPVGSIIAIETIMELFGAEYFEERGERPGPRPRPGPHHAIPLRRPGRTLRPGPKRHLLSRRAPRPR